MTTHFDRIQSLFVAALDKPAADRGLFLNEACAGDSDVRREVEKLLDAHFEASGPLDRAAVATIDMPPVAEPPGTQIGPYKLLQQIGEGGFGVVYMAEQTKPVRRKVALKIIKPGMDTKEVIARFEAERQALALLDHPNIAKVLDAGTTGENHKSEIRNPKEIRSKKSKSQDRADDAVSDIRNSNFEVPSDFEFRDSDFRPEGRPYFVMELVRGVTITEFCDERKLNTRERLQLFIDVCRAVQHAHQKGIIHRDLKPSNILVTLDDGRPIPKVIDFGISKALSQQLTEKTLFTAFGQMIGTPLYMAPEQAEMSMRDVDTRSDVYSLGVLLYELLTGTTPFDKETLQKSGFDEMRRIIREVEPPRPSARISTLRAEMLSTVSGKRHIDPRKLGASLRGELDWIVMKALEKDRNRRYESASAFAADVERYLADEPVQARPASVWYRFRKFARRRKGAFVGVAVVMLFVATIAGGIGWMAGDQAAQQRARQTRLAGQVELILDDVERLMEQQKWPEALAAAQRAEAAIESGNADDATRQQVRTILKDLQFIDRLERIRMARATAVEGKLDKNAGAVRKYAQAFREYGVDVEQLPAETAIAGLKRRPGLAIALAAALDDWVHCRREVSKTDADGWKRLVAVARGIDPDPLRDRLRASWGQKLTPELQADLRRLAESIDVRRQPPATLLSLAVTLRRCKLSDSAVQLLQQAQSVHPGDFWLNFTLGSQLHGRKDDEGSVRFNTTAVGIRPNSVAAHNNLGVALGKKVKLDDAIRCFQKAIELDPKFARAHYALGLVYRRQGKLDDAVRCYKKAIELNSKFAGAHYSLGITYGRQGKLDDAVRCYKKAIELDSKFAGAHYVLGNALQEQGKPDEAIVSYRKAIELDPKNAVVHTNLGNALGSHGKPDEAIASHRKAVELDPKNAAAHSNLGSALHNQGKLDEAVACFRKAIELDPKYAVAHLNLGAALNNQGKRDEAIESFKKAIELDPMDAFAHNVLGDVLARLKKLDEAMACFRKAIQLDPQFAGAHRNFPGAHCNLAWCLANASDPGRRDAKQALFHAERAVALNSKSSIAWQVLGWARYRSGDWKGCIAALQKSIQLQDNTHDRRQWYCLAMAHWQLGHKNEARNWYDKAVAWMNKHNPNHEQLLRLRREAAELLGVLPSANLAPVVAPKPNKD
jgi:serine/threonine-protein kinase